MADSSTSLQRQSYTQIVVFPGNSMKLKYVVVGLSLVAVLSGCAFFEKSEPVEVPEPTPVPVVVQRDAVNFRVLHKADYNLDDRETFKSFTVLDTADTYRSQLSRYSVEVTKPVDFTRQLVLLATMGTQPSGGFKIGVQSAMEGPEDVIVEVLLTSPGPACIHTEALSNPYEFALIETTKPVIFRESSTVDQCQ